MDADAVSQGLDLDDGLSSLLRASTAAAHDEVQRPAIVNLLITGQIPLDLHIKYLMMLERIYERLELALAQHRDHETISTCHNPALLARAGPLDDDLAYFTGTRDWRDLAMAREVRTRGTYPELDDYLDRIDELSDPIAAPVRQLAEPTTVYAPPKARPALLLAHAYVRYMGDLSGGQFIKAAVASAYSLERDGVRFYDFGTLESQDDNATASELKRIKHWLRTSLDAAGQTMSHADKAELMLEANYVFELNVRLFSSFEALAAQHVTGPAPALHSYATPAQSRPLLLRTSSSPGSSADTSPARSSDHIFSLASLEPAPASHFKLSIGPLSLVVVLIALAYAAVRL